MKKKTVVKLSLVLCLLLCMSLVACDNDVNAQGKLTSGDVAAEGAFAEGTTLLVSKLETTDSDYTAAIGKIADKEYDKEKVAVFDISLEKDDAKVQPNGKVKITMPAPFDTENGYVTYHISGETVDELDTFLEDGKISFETAGFSYFVVAGTTGGSSNPNDPSRNYVRVDKDKNPDENGEYILFGSYPQECVAQSGHQTALETALSEKAGDLPENGKNGKWTSFKYYYTVNTDGTLSISNDIDFMWYIDVEHNGEKYRGVYFTNYRPQLTLDGDLGTLDRSVSGSRQYVNGYRVENVYWFKYEPILWKIIDTDGNKVQLLSMSVLDGQAYCTIAERKKDQETDKSYYNTTPGDVPKDTLATNYRYSNIRNWLNVDFYNVAFDEEQKRLVIVTQLDNNAVGLGEDTNDKVFLITFKEAVALNGASREATDYATSIGADANKGESGCTWYLRDRFNGKISVLHVFLGDEPLTEGIERYLMRVKK